MKKINVAIIGVGNCAKALVEGVAYYARNPDDKIGLMHPIIGGYHPADINFVAAFDVDASKVGRQLSEAICAGPNCSIKISDPLDYNVVVQRGPTLDGIAKEMQGSFVKESSDAPVDIAKILQQSGAEVILNYLPTGSEQATEVYAEAALQAKCSFINCMPTPLVVKDEWRSRFESQGLILLGDDIKSQLGATMLNRSLLTLLRMRGVRVAKCEQINTGGNTDHFNLLHRSHAKEKSKAGALTQVLESPDDVKPIVKFEYVKELGGHKRVNIALQGEIFGRVPISITGIIEDEISVNSAGVVVDAIRITRALIDHGRQQEAEKVCPFLMKSPPKPMYDWAAAEMFQEVMHSLERSQREALAYH